MNISNELKYAVDCGIKVEYTVLENGDILATWNNGKCSEILSTDQESKVEEVNPEVEVTVVQEDVISTTEVVDVNSLDLTEKEKVILQAIVDNSYEYGLGIESRDLNIPIKGKSLSGVIGSLTKKGYVEGYMNGNSIGYDEFFNLTEEWFTKLTGEEA